MYTLTQVDKELDAAVGARDIAGIKAALARGGDPNKHGHGDTIFNHAISSKCAESVRLLIESGAELSSKVGNRSYPLIVCKFSGTREIRAMLIAAGATTPGKQEPKKLSVKETVGLVVRGDKQMHGGGLVGLITNQSVEFVYDYRDCLLAIGANRTAKFVTRLIGYLEEIGPRPSEKRALAFIGRNTAHFANLDADYLEIKEDLESRGEKFMRSSDLPQASRGGIIMEVKAKPRKRQTVKLTSEETVELVVDADTQVYWDGLTGLIDNRNVEYVFNFRDGLLAVGAEKKAAVLVRFIEALQPNLRSKPSDKRALALIEKYPERFTGLESAYFDIKEDVEALGEEFLRKQNE